MPEQETEWNPDWVSSPWETVFDACEERGWGLVDLSIKLAIRPASALVEAAVNSLPIDEAMAKKLSAVVGSTPEFWLRREAQYREGLAARARTK